jgi:hypothetical protein
MATIHITNQTQLAAVTSGNDYILDNNIAIVGNWAPLPAFSGSFDGGGNSVSALDAPLFSAVNGGTVRNLTLNVNINMPTVNDIGAIAKTTDSASILNNTVSGNIAGLRDVGGVVGLASSGQISGNTNLSTIKATERSGGIVGHAVNGAVIDDNTNEGSISYPGSAPGWSDGSYTGGIVGDANGVSLAGNINRGAVSGYYSVGGIIGLAQNTATSNNQNQAVITGYYTVGGIVGESDGTQILNSSNSGDITSLVNYAGGIAGDLGNSQVLGSVNSGAVYADSASGGIAGGVWNASTVENNTSCGNVTAGTDLAGGIAGLSDTNNNPTPNVISGNQAFGASVSGGTQVYRIIGRERGEPPLVLTDNIANADMLLTGNNTADGGLIYNNQTVQPTDPEVGSDQLNGESFACPVGFHLEGCAGCVRDECPPGYHWVEGVGCVPDECPPGYHWVEGIGCVPDECPPGYHWVEGVGCVPDECPPGYHWVEGIGCVPDECPPGYHWVEGIGCVPDEPKPPCPPYPPYPCNPCHHFCYCFCIPVNCMCKPAWPSFASAPQQSVNPGASYPVIANKPAVTCAKCNNRHN